MVSGGLNISAHNPEVAGSNPAPATENVQVRAMINFMSLTAFKIIPEPFQKCSPPPRGSMSAPGTEKHGLALVSRPEHTNLRPVVAFAVVAVRVREVRRRVRAVRSPPGSGDVGLRRESSQRRR